MPSSQPRPSAIKSQYADDPEMRELVKEFVTALPERVLALRNAFEEQRLRDLQRLAHQLKGAAGGYGYPTVGSAAGVLETTLKTPEPIELDRVREQLDDLVGLCSRAMAGGR